MKVTPEEIRNYTFNKSFIGYDKDHVEQFLVALSKEWENELDRAESLKNKLESAEKELNRLKDVESIMLRTIKEGDENAQKLLQNAEQKAAELIAEATKTGDEYYTQKKTEGDEYWAKAEHKGDEIIEKAEQEKERLLTEANETIENLKLAAKADLEASEREYNSLDIAKQQLLYDLNSLLGNTTDRLTNIQTKYAPEVFDAKKQALESISKAIVEKKLAVKAPKPKSTKNPEAKTKTVVAKTKQTKNTAAKPIKKAIVKTNNLSDSEPEDDGLPTVQKILAITEIPHLPTVEPEVESPETENKSFFDTI
jgi:cell division initiation protein